MERFDVAVVGLGAMGSAALFHLARRSAKVIGIERFQPNHDRGSSHGESRAIRLGYFEHPSYVPLLRRAYENWRELERIAGEPILTVTGVLEIGQPGSAIVAGSKEASLQHDISFEELDAAEIKRRFPQFTLPSDFTAVWQTDGGYLRPERAVAAHLALARSFGAETVFDTPVSAVDRQPEGIRIALPDRTIEAARVVLAAGAWIGDLVPALKPALKITQQVLVWFKPTDPSAVAPGRLPVFVVDAPNEIGYGFPQISPDGFKCASHRLGRELPHAGFPRETQNGTSIETLRCFLQAYLPGAAGPVSAAKTCLYTNTPDGHFVLDLLPDDPRIVVASPCSGHGFKFASVLGEVLADLALEGGTRHDISLFPISRRLLWA